MVQQTKRVPIDSTITQGFASIDYVDCYSATIHNSETVDQWVSRLFASPSWVSKLLDFRDALVRRFGLKTQDKATINISDHYAPGERAVLFTVIARSENEIVMGEQDKHLNFRVSVLVSEQQGRRVVHLTTIVHYNNIWGRLYFLPVKPFHQVIVAASVRKATQ